MSACHQPMIRGDVYMNLQTQALSLVDRETTSSPTYGTVVGHHDQVRVDDAEAVVYEQKRRQARDTGVKNVHAMFRGNVHVGVEPDTSARAIRYTVAKDGCFYTVDTDEQVLEADHVWISHDGRIFGAGLTTA